MEKPIDNSVRGMCMNQFIIPLESLSIPETLFRIIEVNSRNKMIENDQVALFKTFVFLMV